MSESDESHELVSALKDLAIQLGRIPTYEEFKANVKGAQYRTTKFFSSYGALTKAAGLDAYRERGSKKAITNEVFNRKIVDHLGQYQPRPLQEETKFSRCLFVPDTHFPFGHTKTLESIYRFAEKHDPEYVVQLGDLFDLYSYSKFPRSLNVFTPKEEHDLSVKQAKSMWEELRKAAPNAKCIQLVGNHDLRALKRILEVLPSAEDWIEKMFREMMTFEGVETVFDSREIVKLPGVGVHHGYMSQAGTMRDNLQINMVHGHDHKLYVVNKQIEGRTIFEMSCGLAGDPESKGLSYTNLKLNQFMLGFGWLDEYGPRTVALR